MRTVTNDRQLISVSLGTKQITFYSDNFFIKRYKGRGGTKKTLKRLWQYNMYIWFGLRDTYTR